MFYVKTKKQNVKKNKTVNTSTTEQQRNHRATTHFNNQNKLNKLLISITITINYMASKQPSDS